MRIALFLFFFLAPASLLSCATVGSAAKSCVADASLIEEVAGDLVGPDYAQRLEALVARVGLCIVDRTVEAVIAPSGAQTDPAIVAHGRAWLAAHPAKA